MRTTLNPAWVAYERQQPVTPAPTWTIFPPSVNGPASSFSFSGPLTVGVMFTVTDREEYLQGYRWWVADGAQSTVPQQFALWENLTGSSQDYVAGSVVMSGTLSPGWNYIPYIVPVKLTRGVVYAAVTGLSGNFPYTPGYFAAGGPYTSGYVNGPLTVYSDYDGGDASSFGGNQGLLLTGGSDPTVNYPSGGTGGGGGNFWIDTVITNVQPVPVTIAVTPSTPNIQALVDAAPNGSTFTFGAGTYSGLTISPKPGNIFNGGSQAAVLDGASTATAAFITSSASAPIAPNVTVSGFVIQHYNSGNQQGAIQCNAGASGWTIQGNHVTNNAAAGIFTDSNVRVLNNLLDYNGQEGYSAHGSNILYQGNEIAYSNLNLTFPIGFEAGGGKASETVNAVFRQNYVHDNGGNGLWTDTNNIYTVYDSNIVINNSGAGIYHEISYDAVITGNYVADNGMPSSPGGGDRAGYLFDSGIQLRRSGALTPASPLTITGNVLSNNYNGIGLLESPADPTGEGPPAYGPYKVQNVLIENNIVMMTQGATGVVQDGEGNQVFTANNVFTGNRYFVPAVGSPGDGYTFGWFAWLNGWTDSFPAWQGYGNDTAGTFQLVTPYQRPMPQVQKRPARSRGAWRGIIIPGSNPSAPVTYRLFPSTNGPASSTTFTGGIVQGLAFKVTTSGRSLAGYWYWRSDSSQSATAEFALWTITGASSGTFAGFSSVVNTSSLVTGQWNYLPLGTPIALTAGTPYLAAVGSSGNISYTPNEWGAGNPYAAGITNGPLTAYSDSGGSNPAPSGNNQFAYSAAGSDPTVVFPSTGAGSYNGWLDVQIM